MARIFIKTKDGEEINKIILEALVTINGFISAMVEERGFKHEEMLELANEYTEEMEVWFENVEKERAFPIQLIISFNVLASLAEEILGIPDEVIEKACANSVIIRDDDTEFLKKIKDGNASV